MVLFVLFSAFAADYYADPINGTANGDGSAANPWVSLQQVVADGHFESQGWDALPYVAGQSVLVATSNGTIAPGDTLWLRSGYHGDAVLQGLYNAGPITIAAEAGHTPTLSHLLVRAGANWTFRGLTLSPSFAPIYSTQTVVEFDSHNFHGPVHDCIIEDSEVFSEADISAWTADEWNSLSANGVQVDGDRMTVRNNWVHNVDFGITVNAVGSQIDHNTVENFAGDALRGLGDYTSFEYTLMLQNSVRSRGAAARLPLFRGSSGSRPESRSWRKSSASTFPGVARCDLGAG